MILLLTPPFHIHCPVNFIYLLFSEYALHFFIFPFFGPFSWQASSFPFSHISRRLSFEVQHTFLLFSDFFFLFPSTRRNLLPLWPHRAMGPSSGYLVFCYWKQVPSPRLRPSEDRECVWFTSVTLNVPHALVIPNMVMSKHERDFHLHRYKNCQELWELFLLPGCPTGGRGDTYCRVSMNLRVGVGPVLGGHRTYFENLGSWEGVRDLVGKTIL